MNEVIEYVPPSDRSTEVFTSERAAALVQDYVERAGLLANDPNLSEEVKKVLIEEQALRLGYKLMSEYYLAESRKNRS